MNLFQKIWRDKITLLSVIAAGIVIIIVIKKGLIFNNIMSITGFFDIENTTNEAISRSLGEEFTERMVWDISEETGIPEEVLRERITVPQENLISSFFTKYDFDKIIEIADVLEEQGINTVVEQYFNNSQKKAYREMIEALTTEEP